MTYKVLLEPVARRELRSLPNDVLYRIDATIRSLSRNPLPAGVVRVRGKAGSG